jgi:phosphatidylserine/phosphatidylglycerophosphate/cardiolipin synthase-like enzyme
VGGWVESRVNKGLGRFGAYHVKELVVNRHTLFTGSANFTTNSRSNRERCYKMTGTLVAQAVSDLAADRTAGSLWTP